jgi:hypothetical protein
LGFKLYKQGKIKDKGVNLKKMIFILPVLTVLVGTVFAGKLATLTGIMKPDSIYIDNRQIYIMENPTFFIYSLEDFRLKKKFGKPGEGPREFKGTAPLIPHVEHLLVNSADEKKAGDALRLLYKQQYEELTHRLAFPDYFPGIEDFQVTDNKIYVSTWKVENGGNEWFIFDLQGKLLKRLFVPIAFLMPLEPYPYTVKNDNLYQLIENENEQWELYANRIME